MTETLKSTGKITRTEEPDQIEKEKAQKSSSERAEEEEEEEEENGEVVGEHRYDCSDRAWLTWVWVSAFVLNMVAKIRRGGDRRDGGVAGRRRRRGRTETEARQGGDGGVVRTL
ncbi:hypothetical protein K1719_032523 [Acacia pycnantha]|nr:hypothetical protein K1719_032523 [Acacia pycnantha]